jgi:hypothetical protein
VYIIILLRVSYAFLAAALTKAAALIAALLAAILIVLRAWDAPQVQFGDCIFCILHHTPAPLKGLKFTKPASISRKFTKPEKPSQKHVQF